LTRQGAEAPRIHNLVVLHDILAETDSRFETLDHPIERLNPFSVAIRYRGIETTPADAQAAFQAASEVRVQIRQLLNLEGKA
jgi:hypothetical protein